MAQRTASEIIEQYQPLLRKYEKDEKLVLTDADEELGTQAGENFMSIVLRTNITGKQGNGSPYKKSFMRKKLIENEQFASLTRSADLFRNEAHYYSKLAPLLGPFGPECILAEPGEIIMEDLGKRNFSIIQKRKQLDLDHCLAVMKTLASLHATSLCLRLGQPEKYRELSEPLSEAFFSKDEGPAVFEKFFENGLEHAVYILKSFNSDSPDIEKSIEFLKKYEGHVVETLKKLMEPTPGDGNIWAMTHGDTWNNNILFLHNAQGKVTQVKLVDFQIVRPNASPSNDLIYFFYSSARTEVLENHLEQLLTTYENTFCQEMRRLGLPEKDIEALIRPGWVKKEICKYGLFGFFGSLMVIHAIFMDEKIAAEFEQNKTEEKIDYTKEKKFEDWPVDPEKNERIKFMLSHFIKNFHSTN